jgi:nucleotide-binding universal stress UspA family protein
MIRGVLAALDGSARAPGVFDAAVDLAARFGATLRLLRVVFVPPEFPAAAAGNPADALPAHLTQVARDEMLALIARAAPCAVAIEAPLVRFGIPWRVILEVSEHFDVDLIVVGSHGYHGLDRILGTTAARVANMARRSVLVVHERPAPPAPRDPGGTPYRQG